jgi:hypothetical protein
MQPMSPKKLVDMPIKLNLTEQPTERREKSRFPIERELRYKILEDTKVVQSGSGVTVNISSGGVAFAIDHELKTGCYIELSVSWPILLDDSCPMRLVCYGRVMRSNGGRCACTIHKYEFRTQARVFQATVGARNDVFFQRWADTMRKETMKTSLVRV